MRFGYATICLASLLILGIFAAGAIAADQTDAGVQAPSTEELDSQALAEEIEKRLPQDATSTPKGNDLFKEIDLAKIELEEGRYRQEVSQGHRIFYTFDTKLQGYARSLLADYDVPLGAAVMINSRTGRVIAMVESHPRNKHTHVALDPSFPAASLFKIVTAAALIEKGQITLDTTTCYRGGSHKLTLEHLSDPPRNASSCASLETALGRSINAIFAKLADRNLSREILVEYAKRFGFNQELPFDLPVEISKAMIPKDRLERARTAAGFWHTQLSPLHAAVIAQSLGQRGAMLRPYIVESVVSQSGETIYEVEPKYIANAVTEQTALDLVRAMTSTIKRGTARKAFFDPRGVPFLPGTEVAGKTGTLTNSKPYRAYTWFLGVAPADHPEIALAVLVGNEPRWRIKASGVAVKLLKKYFDLSREKRRTGVRSSDPAIR